MVGQELVIPISVPGAASRVATDRRSYRCRSAAATLSFEIAAASRCERSNGPQAAETDLKLECDQGRSKCCSCRRLEPVRQAQVRGSALREWLLGSQSMRFSTQALGQQIEQRLRMSFEVQRRWLIEQAAVQPRLRLTLFASGRSRAEPVLSIDSAFEPVCATARWTVGDYRGAASRCGRRLRNKPPVRELEEEVGDSR